MKTTQAQREAKKLKRRFSGLRGINANLQRQIRTSQKSLAQIEESITCAKS